MQIVVNYVASLVYRKKQIYLKYHYLHTVGLLCSKLTASGKEDLTWMDVAPYLYVSQLVLLMLK